jgi:hypothetical protein
MRLEVAVQLHWSSAVAISEHAAIHLLSELGHLGSFVLGWQPLRLVVEGLNLLADLEALVGHSTVSDAIGPVWEANPEEWWHDVEASRSPPSR